MKKKGNIVTYTAGEIRAMVAREEDRTNWKKFDEMTEEELEASIRMFGRGGKHCHKAGHGGNGKQEKRELFHGTTLSIG